MSYNNYIMDRVEKYKQFFKDDTPGQILVIICPYTFEIDYEQWDLGSRPLNNWDFKKQAKEFMDYNIRRLRCFMEYTKDLDNDFIPAISPGMGVGVHSAYFSGAEVIMGYDTSWVHPVIREWSDIEKLKMDEYNPWFCILKEMIQYCVNTCEGDYVVSTLCNFGPGDMANALRGNDLFYDLYDNPQKVHELMDKSSDAIIWLEEELRKIAGMMEGGVVTANVWLPGQAPYISEDFTDLCSSKIFNEFGYKYTQKIINHFGGAYIHHHAKGYHVHKDIASLKNLKMLEISLDPNCLRPVDHLEELFEMNNGIPLMIRCSARDVYQEIEHMKKGRLVIMLNIDTIEEGRDVMKFIRKNSII
ncbi:MAG: hypothetical protein HPY74_10250 [Firmicutes bacterium]|nr:hypothetical protein [Bacillota bacterium]